MDRVPLECNVCGEVEGCQIGGYRAYVSGLGRGLNVWGRSNSTPAPCMDRAGYDTGTVPYSSNSFGGPLGLSKYDNTISYR